MKAIYTSIPIFEKKLILCFVVIMQKLLNINNAVTFAQGFVVKPSHFPRHTLKNFSKIS